MYQIGDKIVFKDRFENEDLEDVAIGQVYEVVGEDLDGDLYFIDLVGDKNYAGINDEGDGICELVD